LRGSAEYVEALRTELRSVAQALPGIELDTVFVGGGTPGLLPPAQLAGIVEEVRSGFGLSASTEITIEANPSSTSASRAAAWRAAGVTRVSLGVQSLDADALRFLGRVHGPQRALDALGEVRDAGFERINADLIYAVPGLDDAAWRRTLELVLERDPGHLSCYELTVEPGTPLAAAVDRGAISTVDAETALRQHWIAAETATSAGYAQYEVSNFARRGHECGHNLAYWRNQYYLAVGVGAHGHLPIGAARTLGVVPAAAAATGDTVAARYWHPRDPVAYRALVAAGGLGVDGFETLNAADREIERVMVGLRLAGGVRLERAEALDEARRLAQSGLVVVDGDLVRTTRMGQEVLNGVAVRLLDGAV
jgi:oxygen-independent coproporphyrinogen-3 oxidase